MTFLMSAAVAVAVLGISGPTPAIAHGDAVPAGHYSFAGRLVMTGIPTGDGGSRDSWCSGALVAQRWVITAGHCFRNAAGRRVAHPVARRTTVTFHASAGGTRRATVIAVRQSPSNDVALAELDHEVTGITPLTVIRSAPAKGEKLRLTGYGVTNEDGRAPVHLQTGGFVITSTADTVIEVAGASPRPDTSACLHDSGAPYFREPAGGTPELVSVVSEGPPCPHTGPDVAARVDVIAGWITGTIHPDVSGQRTGVAIGLSGVVIGLLVASGLLLGAFRRRQSRSQSRSRSRSRKS
jgi:secreted trypsin-like serine protease